MRKLLLTFSAAVILGLGCAGLIALFSDGGSDEPGGATLSRDQARGVEIAMRLRFESATRSEPFKGLAMPSAGGEGGTGEVVVDPVAVGTPVDASIVGGYRLSTDDAVASGAAEGERVGPGSGDADWQIVRVVLKVKECESSVTCRVGEKLTFGLAIGSGGSVDGTRFVQYLKSQDELLTPLTDATKVFADFPDIRYSIPLDGELLGVVDPDGTVRWPFASDDVRAVAERQIPDVKSLGDS